MAWQCAIRFLSLFRSVFVGNPADVHRGWRSLLKHFPIHSNGVFHADRRSALQAEIISYAAFKKGFIQRQTGATVSVVNDPRRCNSTGGNLTTTDLARRSAMATRRHCTASRSAFLLVFALLFPLSSACPATFPPLSRPRISFHHLARWCFATCHVLARALVWHRRHWLMSAELDCQRRYA